jgi:hypothetical protein
MGMVVAPCRDQTTGMAQVGALQEKIQSAAKAHNGYLEELGLPPLPFGLDARWD